MRTARSSSILTTLAVTAIVLATPAPAHAEDKYLEAESLLQCFSILRDRLSPELLEEIRNRSSHIDMMDYHHGLGQWIRNSFGLWTTGDERTTFKRYMDRVWRGHPDDQSSFILECFWIHLHHPSYSEAEILAARRQAVEHLFWESDTRWMVLIYASALLVILLGVVICVLFGRPDPGPTIPSARG